MSNQPQYLYVQQVKAPSNGMATAALVLGIVAIVCGVWSPLPILGLVAAGTGFIPAVLAIVLGHLGVRQSRTLGIGHGAGMTGLVLGYVTVGIIVLTTVLWLVAIGASSGQSS